MFRAIQEGFNGIVSEFHKKNEVRILEDGRRGLIFLLTLQTTEDGLAPANHRAHLDLLWSAVPRPINVLNLPCALGNTTFFRPLSDWDGVPEKFEEWDLAKLNDYFASQADYLGQPWEPIQTQSTQPVNP